MCSGRILGKKFFVFGEQAWSRTKNLQNYFKIEKSNNKNKYNKYFKIKLK